MSEQMQKTQQQPVTLAQFLDQRREALAQVIPKHLSVDRLLKVALNSVSKSEALRKCTMTSVLQCVVTCAELGLEPGGALGGAYLVPYKDTCTLIIGYRGYVDLMRRSGLVSTVHAVVVHEKDRFRYREGLETTLEHEPYLEGDPGPLRFVYCVIKLKDGGYQVEVMSKHQVDLIGNAQLAKAYKPETSPWKLHYEEQAKKTVIRRAAKLAPMSSEMARAMEAEDDYVDGEVVAQSRELVGSSAAETLKAKSAAARPALMEPAPMPEVEAPKPTPEPARRTRIVDESGEVLLER